MMQTAPKTITLTVKNLENDVEFEVYPYDDERSFICCKEELEFLQKELPGKTVKYIPKDSDIAVTIPMFEFYADCVMHIGHLPEEIQFYYNGNTTMTDDYMSAVSILKLSNASFNMFEAIKLCSEHGQVIHFETFARSLSSIQAEVNDRVVRPDWTQRFYTVYSYFEKQGKVLH